MDADGGHLRQLQGTVRHPRPAGVPAARDAGVGKLDRAGGARRAHRRVARSRRRRGDRCGSGLGRAGRGHRGGSRRPRHGRRPGCAVEPGLPAGVRAVHAQPRPQRARLRPSRRTLTMTYRTGVVLAMLLGLAVTAGAADDKLGATLRGVVEENVRAYDARDTDAFLRTLHPKSPGYEATKAILSDQFREGDIKVTLVDYKYIGHDDEFAVARVKMKTVAPPGSTGFQSNVTDSVVLFHRDEFARAWKLWSDDIIGVEFVPQ